MREDPSFGWGPLYLSYLFRIFYMVYNETTYEGEHMFTKDEKQPIEVVVQNGRYNAYSMNTVPTKRDKWLMATLVGMGGVSESVEPGRYHFNIKRVSFLRHEVTLNSK